ncbi:MAG: hypothetical protein H0W72_12505 [Planctomycetes bacterium]|nr:hypothetical protein [Planctomycetota bacterium]
MLRSLPLFALVAGLGAADASSYWVRVMPAAWSVTADGSVAYSEGGGTATRFDLEELDVDNRELAPMVDVQVRFPVLFDIAVGGHRYATDGDATLTRSFTFGGITYNAAERVHTDVDLLDAYAEVLVRLPIPGDLVVAGLGLAGHYVGAEIEVTSQTSGQRERLDEDLPIPAVAARVQLNLPASIGIEAAGHFLAIATDKADGRFLDLRGQVSWRPIPWLGLAAGYRYLSYGVAFETNDQDTDVDLTFAGPYAALVAQF